MGPRSAGLPVAVLASLLSCSDETVEVVTQDVCWSEQRWVGGKRGSPEMYPGRDCVGCHIANDGPELALGGTVYAYVLDRPEAFAVQSGTDCFGLEGVTVRIEDSDGQIFELSTNRAGNFFVEGNPADFEKPFGVEIQLGTFRQAMITGPMYGGCARCHDPAAPSATDQGIDYNFNPVDADYRNGTARIGVPGYRPSGPDGPSVEDALRQLAGMDP